MLVINSRNNNKATIFFSLLLSLSIGLLFTACGGGAKPIEIIDLKTYTDEALQFSIQYPSNWQATISQSQRVIVFSSNDAKSRFFDYAPAGFPGAMIDLFVTKVDENKTEDSIINNAKKFSVDYRQSTVTLDGIAAQRFDYSFPLMDGEFKGAFIIASKDETTYTILKFETFADSWHFYENDFNKIINSLVLAKTQRRGQDTLTVYEELPFPSDVLTERKGNGFSISVPDNFDFFRGPTKEIIGSYNYIGERRGDCNILVDVIDGSEKENLKEAAAELAAKYPGSPKISPTKIGNMEAFVINYKPIKDVNARVYFAKKGDKIFRISMNWYIPEQSNYLPVFEKSIASIIFTD